jgi:predicted transcriptional regulator YdeE
MYAVYSDDESDGKGEYLYLIGCGVTCADTVPEGLAVRHIPTQTCAVFKVNGQKPDEVLAIWSMVWLSSLPRTYAYDFEVYDQRFTRPKKKEVDICIGIDPNPLDSVE